MYPFYRVLDETRFRTPNAKRLHLGCLHGKRFEIAWLSVHALANDEETFRIRRAALQIVGSCITCPAVPGFILIRFLDVFCHWFQR